jgi:hypothetical protein
LNTVKELSGFPCFEIKFDRQGSVFDQNEVEQALAFLGKGSATDLFIISHGWNNDMAEARTLYSDFFARLRQVLDAGAVAGANGRKYAVVAVLWPSKKFADDELKPSGAAGIGSPVTAAYVQKQLDGLKGTFDNPDSAKIIDKAKALVARLEDSPAARREFADLVRSLPGKKGGDNEDGSDHLFRLSGDEVMDRLSKPLLAAPPRQAPAGGAAALGDRAAGGAAGLGNFFSGVRSAARNLLNMTTYYQMKERAGIVGRSGASEVIRKIRAKAPKLKLHLIGHSFGGRLVTAAALGGEGQEPVRFESMTLLQAAFSHNGFAQKFDQKNDGFFRKVVAEGRISGPILITCTSNDKAVGLAYPLASLLAGANASALGDKNDPYGGLGRNGAQHTPEASDGILGEVGCAYAFQPGKLHNLNADKIIRDHSDICKKEIAYALLTAIAKS